jgi:hypothetical protein
MRDETWRCSICVCVLTFGGAWSAAAQTTQTPKWEVEFHGGGLFSTNPTGGTISLPAPGQPFMTVPLTATASPLPSRYESSWYFGDGTLLFNQAAAALGQLPDQIVPLDPVLGGPLGEHRSGGSVGVRVSRALTPRVTAELGLDYGFSTLRITPANGEAIETTRASFIQSWRGVILFNRNRVLNGLTSTATLTQGSAHQLFTSGAVNINLMTSGTLIPYVTVGAGVASMTGGLPSATLTGNYQFLSGTAPFPPVDETDNVTVHDARRRHTLAGVLGGGVKYHVSTRWGVRFDARVALSKAAANTDLDATPNVARGTPAGRGALGGTPSIQFSNTTDPVTSMGVTAVATSSLTGPPLRRHRTFTGSGALASANATIGVFWRF